MLDLKKEQQMLFWTMRYAGGRGFVHLCDDDGALWVSDMPRHTADPAPVLSALQNDGVAAWTEENGLLKLDWTAQKWQEMLAEDAVQLPPLPADDALHPAYALCRLLLLHPAPLVDAHLPVVRHVLKRMPQPRAQMLKSIPALHQQAAQQLRMHQPCAHAAGKLLAAWLNEQISKEE